MLVYARKDIIKSSNYLFRFSQIVFDSQNQLEYLYASLKDIGQHLMKNQVKQYTAETDEERIHKM